MRLSFVFVFCFFYHVSIFVPADEREWFPWCHTSHRVLRPDVHLGIVDSLSPLRSRWEKHTKRHGAPGSRDLKHPDTYTPRRARPCASPSLWCWLPHTHTPLHLHTARCTGEVRLQIHWFHGLPGDPSNRLSSKRCGGLDWRDKWEFNKTNKL